MDNELHDMISIEREIVSLIVSSSMGLIFMALSSTSKSNVISMVDALDL